MGMDLPLRAIRGQIASSIELIIHLGKLKSGERRILEIQELIGLDGDQYEFRTLFQHEEDCLHSHNRLLREQNLRNYGQLEHYREAMDTYEQEIG